MPDHFGVLTGASSNPFSMYSTTNSVNHAPPPKRTNSGLPKGEKPVTGFCTNGGTSVNSGSGLSGMKTENQWRFQNKNSVIGVLQEHNELLNNPNASIKVPVGASTGFKKNKSSFAPKDQIGMIGDLITDKKSLSEFKLSDPISAENQGRGPDRWSTTSKSIHNSKPLADDSLPSNVDELRTGQTLSTGLTGGYISNNVNTLDPTLSSETSTTYNNTVGSGDYEKFYKKDKDSVNYAPQLVNKSQALKNDPYYISTGYKYAEYPAASISQKTLQGLKKLNEIDSNKDEEELRLLKLSNPVQYDDITEKRSQFDTINRVHYSEKSVKERSLPSNVDFSTTDPSLHSGFARNNEAPFFMDRQPDTTTSVYGSSFRNSNTIKAESTFKTQEKAPNRRSAFTLLTPKVASSDPTASLTETLKRDHVFLQSLHPSVRTHLQFSDPASYGNAVPTYEHKRRI